MRVRDVVAQGDNDIERHKKKTKSGNDTNTLMETRTANLSDLRCDSDIHEIEAIREWKRDQHVRSVARLGRAANTHAAVHVTRCTRHERPMWTYGMGRYSIAVPRSLIRWARGL
jgi:hypothetical protein